ncbi:MAG: glycosyltransferase, partial [Bacteroidales bacterium]|nr:glycosyltransferase [Bacteroidales bacterium]
MGRLWDEAKNIRLLTEAAKEIDFPVFIAGTGFQADYDQLPNNVHFLGKLGKRDISRWLSIASVYTMPAMYEPFGLSVLEAAYSGCALLLGKIPSLEEIWKDNALYCPPNDKNELARMITQLMDDDELRQNLA